MKSLCVAESRIPVHDIDWATPVHIGRFATIISVLFSFIIEHTHGKLPEISEYKSSDVHRLDHVVINTNDADGFTTDAGSGGNPYRNTNQNGDNYVSWNWKAGGSGSSNTDGSITSTVSANTTAGFSIVSYTGTGANATVGHGLGVTPEMFIIKDRTSGTANDWFIYNKNIGATKYLRLNDIGGQASSSTLYQDTDPTSSVFSIGTNGNINTNGNNYIAYCFAEKKGYSKFGSYTGNGNADGTFVYLGFKPAVVIFKTYTTNGGWQIYDNKRNNGNPTAKFLVPSSNAAEASGSNDIDFLSNGFKTRTTNNPGTTDSFIYMAFAEAPLVGSNNVPCTAN